ncbi:chaplin [Streptomyces sp. enrichment culture]|uniref:chaplin n=1 Tax=Streptomyces sp. enrichment culture TaxID=1795815 RepID=UPI003F5802A4
MRRVTRNGVLAVVAASGAMAAAGAAHADSSADGTAAGSPGVISGNSIQLPVQIPVNACGNTVNVVGLLNPAAGTTCVNEAEAAHPEGPPPGSAAGGGTTGSPGVISGNGVHLPVELPVNVSGNTVNVVGIGNPVLGNESVNTPGGEPASPQEPPRTPQHPPKPEPPSRPAPHAEPPRTHPAGPPAREDAPPQHAALAHTGTDATLPAAVGSAALLLGGLALHRTARRRARD